MKRTVAISVIIPAYNEATCISGALKDLTQQKCNHPYEIIVVDNNSTDATVKIAKKFKVLVVSEKQQGVLFARQKGLNSAKGEIIVGADADNRYPKDWLQSIYTHFKDKNIVAVGGRADAGKNPHWAYLLFKYGFSLVDVIYRNFGVVVYLGAFNFAMRREVFIALGGYHTYLDAGGDEWDPLARLKKVGKIVYDHQIKIDINTRRYREGFLKFFFVHWLIYYTLSYQLSRIFKRRFIQLKAVRE